MANWADDIAPVVRTVADLDFDGIEVSLLGMTDEKVASLSSIVKEHGLSITCTTGLSRDADIASADAAQSDQGIAYMRWAIGAAAALGAHVLTGVIYAPWGHFEPDAKKERTERAATALGSLDGDLERLDVVLGLEAINRFETDLVNTAAEATALAEQAGSQRIGVLLDTFHMNIEETELRSAIRTAGKHLKHFHCSDNNRGVPGAGHVPWDDVRAGLADIEYDDWVVMEMFVQAGLPTSTDLNIWRPMANDPTRAAADGLAFLRDKLG